MSCFDLALLLAMRVAGAAKNIVHDCDEVYNYWEPLHYLLYQNGMQTWEYSSKFALRSYLYILLHWPLASPAAALLGDGANKYLVFYAVRIVLACMSAYLEWRLISWAQMGRMWFGQPHPGYLQELCTDAPPDRSCSHQVWAIDCTTGVLNGNKTEVILAAAVGVTLGWPVAGIALLPFALYIMLSGGFASSFATLVAALVPLLGGVLAVDGYYYGRTTFSLWNFIQYNVLAGGESARYGTEPFYFYILNSIANFNLLVPLACCYPVLAGLQCLGLISKPYNAKLLIAIAPLYVWATAISCLPHKEERFLYVVYPHIVLAACCALDLVPRLLSDWVGILFKFATARDLLRRAGSVLITALVAASIFVSASRTAAMLKYYHAPMDVWHHLSQVSGQKSMERGGPVLVCTGAEWHQFPSSFFVPEPLQLAFIDSPFEGHVVHTLGTYGAHVHINIARTRAAVWGAGLLPKAYDPTAGGTTAAPVELNDENRKDSRLVLPSAEPCSWLVELVPPGHPPAAPPIGSWTLAYEAPFVDNAKSRFPFRAFWLPLLGDLNAWGRYVLWQRQDV